MEIEQAYHKNMLNYGFDPRVSYSPEERKKVHGMVCEIEAAYLALSRPGSGRRNPFMDARSSPVPGLKDPGAAPPETLPLPEDASGAAGRSGGPIKKEGMDLEAKGAYNRFFGFKESPFNLTPDPKFFYLSVKHKEALAHLFFGLQEQKGFVVITGEVGTGKTILCRSFLTQLDASVKLAYLFNPCLSDLELLQSINAEFGLPSGKTSKKDLISDFNRFLLEARRAGEKVVLVIDEAQDLEAKTLEQLRLLSNLETETEKLLQIVLVGQPELLATLKAHGLRQLAQRITVRWSLSPLDRDETRSYLQHRLKIARDWGSVNFTDGAVRRIFQASRGVPRIVNVLADRALLVAYTLGRKTVNRKIATLAIANYRRNPPAASQPLPRASGRLITLVLALFFTLYMGAWNIDFLKSLEMDRMITKAADRAGVQDIAARLSHFFFPPADQRFAGKDPRISPPADRKNGAAPSAPATPANLSIRKEEGKGGALMRALRNEPMEQNRLHALNAVLKLWKAPPLSGIEFKSFLDDSIKDRGLGLFVFDGDLEKMKKMDYPIILELVFPGEEGKRYLAVKAVSAEGVEAASSPGGRVSPSGLRGAWSGKGLVLWKDFQSLGFNLKRGDRGPQVFRLQEGLESLGFFNAGKTSYFGERTLQAVMAFQKRYGLNTDGIAGPEMKMKLYKLLKYDIPSLAADSSRTGRQGREDR